MASGGSLVADNGERDQDPVWEQARETPTRMDTRLASTGPTSEFRGCPKVPPDGVKMSLVAKVPRQFPNRDRPEGRPSGG